MFHRPVLTIHHQHRPTNIQPTNGAAPALVTLHRKERCTAAVVSRASPGKTASLYSSSPWSQGFYRFAPLSPS